VRAYLAERLRALGLAVKTQGGTLTPRGKAQLVRWGGAADAVPTDVIGVLPGADRTGPAVLLMAHHDTVAGSPGAADDATAVASILESVRALQAGPPLRRDLVVLFTDAEEIDSSGAAAFFAAHPLARRIGAVINLDARGGGGRTLMFETGRGNGPMMRLFADAVREPSANSAAVLVYRLLPNYTDFTVAGRRGLPGFNFAFLGAPGLYHAPQADARAVAPGAVQHMGDQTLDLARALLAAPNLPGRGPDAVFADVFGRGLVIYPAWGGWLVLGLALVLWGVAGVRAARAGQLGVREVASGVVEAVGLVLVAAGLLQLANGLSGAGPHANYFGRLALIPRLEGQAALICLAVVFALAGRTASRARLPARWLGVGAVVFAIALAVQVAAPGAGPVFAWPVLLAGATAAVCVWLDPALGRPGALAVATLAAVVGLGWSLSLAHFAFLGVGPDLPGGMAIFLLIGVMLLRPLMDARLRAVVFLAAVALLAAGFVLALVIRTAPPAPTIPVYARDL
jgi:hypothetical protein